MAIDNNTNYGLSGTQIKDLAARINKTPPYVIENLGSIDYPANQVIAYIYDPFFTPVAIDYFSDYTDEGTLPTQYWAYDPVSGALSITPAGYTYLANEVSGWEAGDALWLYLVYSANPYAYVELGTVGDNKAPVITMTTTDPGEGQPLEPNHFIAVYAA